jgi:DNA polymerase III subunit epsilon
MPWYFRRSRKYGPFRVTISNSGISGSVGLGGVRLTSSKRGTYVSASPGGGLYFRERVGPTNSRPLPPAANDPTVMQGIASTDASGMVEHKAILERINANEARGSWLPWAGIAIAVTTSVIWSPIGLVLGIVCIAVCFGAREYLRGTSPVELDYRLGDEEKRKHEILQTAFNSLEGSRRLWQINAFGNTDDWKRNGGANQLIKRTNASTGRGTPRSFRANVEVPSLKLKRETLYFLPDMLFVQQRRTFGSVAYASLVIADSVTRFNETEDVPSGAQVVGTTWRFVNRSGGPDRRFNNNRQIPVVLYGEIALRSKSGLRVAMMTSCPEASHSFAEGIREMQVCKPAQMSYLQAPTA